MRASGSTSRRTPAVVRARSTKSAADDTQNRLTSGSFHTSQLRTLPCVRVARVRTMSSQSARSAGAASPHAGMPARVSSRSGADDAQRAIPNRTPSTSIRWAELRSARGRRVEPRGVDRAARIACPVHHGNVRRTSGCRTVASRSARRLTALGIVRQDGSRRQRQRIDGGTTRPSTQRSPIPLPAREQRRLTVRPTSAVRRSPVTLPQGRTTAIVCPPSRRRRRRSERRRPRATGPTRGRRDRGSAAHLTGVAEVRRLDHDRGSAAPRRHDSVRGGAEPRVPWSRDREPSLHVVDDRPREAGAGEGRALHQAMVSYVAIFAAMAPSIPLMIRSAASSHQIAEHHLPDRITIDHRSRLAIRCGPRRLEDGGRWRSRCRPAHRRPPALRGIRE